MPPLAAAIPRPEVVVADTPAIDEESFRLFYNRTARPLRTYLLSCLVDRSLADDILQDSFLRFLQAELPVTMEDEHRKNYLFRIATNLMRDHFKRVKAVPLSDSASGESFEQAAVQKEDFQRTMAQLKPQQRQLLWLAYVEQFSHNEIATMVGAKTDSIRPMLARARQSLIELLRLRAGALK